MTKSLYALVGMKHRGTEALVASLPQGEPLTLLREPSNAHDRNAVQVWARGKLLGYVKGSQVAPLAARMDAAASTQNRPLPAGVHFTPPTPARLAIDGGRWPMVEVGE